MSLPYLIAMDLYFIAKYVENTVHSIWFFLRHPFPKMEHKPHHDEYTSADEIQKYDFYGRLNAHPIGFSEPFVECTKVVDVAENEDSFRYVYFYCGESIVMKETYSPLGFLLIREIFSVDEQWCVRFHFFWNGMLRTRAILKDDELTDLEDTPSIENFDEYGFRTSRTWSTPSFGSPLEELFNFYGQLIRTNYIAPHRSAHLHMEDVCEDAPSQVRHYCVICLTEDDSKFIHLCKCCNQFLHKECFQEWIKKKTTCPHCRFDFSAALEIN